MNLMLVDVPRDEAVTITMGCISVRMSWSLFEKL